MGQADKSIYAWNRFITDRKNPPLTYVDLHPLPALREVVPQRDIEVLLVRALPHVPNRVVVGLKLSHAVDATAEQAEGHDNYHNLKNHHACTWGHLMGIFIVKSDL